MYNHVALTVYYHEDTGLMTPGKRIVKVVNTFHSVIQLSGNIRALYSATSIIRTSWYYSNGSRSCETNIGIN